LKKTISITIILTSICITTSIAQKISWVDLPFETVDEISSSNDSLVDMTQYPLLSRQDNGLMYRVMQSDYPDFQKKPLIKSIVDEYIDKNDISDNGIQGEHYAITYEGEFLKLRKHKTIKRYFYGEGSGVKDYTIIDEIPGFDEKDIFCIFNDQMKYQETQFTLFTFKSPSENWFISPNKLLSYRSTKSEYQIEYSSQFCENHFQVQGHGTIYPTHYNIRLVISDNSTGKTQTLLKVPYEMRYRLSKIQFGDINNDNIDDIVLTLIDDTCETRLLYLSEPKNQEKLFRYVGNMMIYCDYP